MVYQRCYGTLSLCSGNTYYLTAEYLKEYLRF